MTRENKLALIVGFGLVLFVGILVSDHPSTARRQAAASLNLGITASTSQAAPLGEGWLVYGTATPPETATPGERDHDLVDTEPLPFADSRHDSPHHVVAAGDTLQSICLRHYGDASLDQRLADYNQLPDPNRLAARTRLLLPPVDVLVPAPNTSPTTPIPAESSPVAVAAQATPPRGDSMGNYTVKSGDTLSELAQKLLGSARDTDRLYELNQDVLRHRDDLRVGTSLRYPLSP